MGCQSKVILGNNLTFSICTHDPDTGVLTDADSAPAYRVYEDETGTAILTGTMTVLDDTNTTGFYTELIACTTANGFEVGKSYTIYITATVDSDQGGIAYSFEVEGDIYSSVSAIALGEGVGSGAVSTVVNITVGGVAEDGVEVWVTSDEAGATVVAGTLTTDGSGNVTFMLDAGTYYVWKQKNGINFTNPESMVVT